MLHLFCPEIFEEGDLGGFPLLHQSQTCQWNSIDLQCFRANYSQSVHFSHFLVNYNDCLMHNIESGITFLKYFYPQNISQPDQTMILPHINVKSSYNDGFSENSMHYNKSLVNIGRILGHIHPFGLKPYQDNKLRLYLGSTSPYSTFFFNGHTINSSNISTDSSKTFHRSFFDLPINFSSDTLLEDNFLIDLIVQFPIRITSEVLEYEKIEINLAESANSVLSNSNLTPFRDDHQCHQLSSCTACLSNIACGWSLSQQCTSRSNLSHSEAERTSVMIDAEQCITCTDFTECEACLSSSDWCEWLPQESQCLRRGRSPRSLHHLSMCSQLCSSRVSCELCLDETGHCVWCQSRQQCISAAAYHSSPHFDYCHSFDLQLYTGEQSFFPHNQHLIAKFNLNSSQILCDKCLRHSTCLLCESVPLCGWCFLQPDSSQGYCATRNHLNENECNFSSKLIYSSTVISIKDGREEHFIAIHNRTCPLVNECLQEHLHNCHPDADCIDTEQSFRCSCRPGFLGDGHSCMRTCAEDCLHGYCSHFPDYKCICDLGWRGAACSEDCGCNNHSTCHNGKCDRCEDNTAGEHCQLCRLGSFGNATNSSIGCTPCQCNLHGDELHGHCDTETGHCRCLHNSEGAHCERCQAGFYGDARQGGHCFMECQDRAMISQVDHGHFGSYIRDVHFKKHSSLNDLSGAHISCLWIFTTHKLQAKSETFESYYSSLDHNLSLPIQITVFKKGQLNCSSSKVTIYDGIPQYISASAKTKFTTLASLCGREILAKDVTVVSMSGFVTVYYTSDSLLQGFNASYTKLFKMETDERAILQTNQSISLSPPLEIHRKTLVQISSHLDSLTDDKNWPKGQHFLYSWSEFLVVIGGDEDAAYLNVAAFDKSSKSWLSNELMNIGDERPSNRHFYASTNLNDMFFVSGGLSIENSQQVFSDFWSCVAIEHETDKSINFKWSKVEAQNKEIIPATMGHSLTVIDRPISKFTEILLIGGYSPYEGFSQHQFLYSPLQNLWKRIITQGALPIGVFGHSAVYYNQLNAVYLFGGVVHVETQKSVISDTLYVLNMTTRVWHRIRPSDSARSGSWPNQRYLYMAAVISDYMLISGGQDKDGVHVEDSFWIYQFGCDNWTMLNMSQFDADEAAGLIYRPRIQSLAYEPSDDLFYIYEFAMISNSTKNQIRRRISTLQIPDDKFSNSRKCNTAKQSFACSMYDNCIDCTTKNYVFRSVREAESCQWCTNCRDKQGHCVALNDTCDWLHSNTSRIDVCHYSSVEDVSQCPLRRCSESDCDKCLQISQAKSGGKSSCIWTRQVYKFIKFGHNPEMSPVEDWTCIDSGVINESLLTNVETVPPLACPARCHKHSTCSLCLEAATGDESGSHECLYDTISRECISPTYALLRCSADAHACGRLLHRNLYAQCPLDCEVYRKASDCIRASHCGWCAITGPFELDGMGVCLRGGLFDSFSEPCSGENANLLTLLTKKPSSTFTAQWHYLYLPKGVFLLFAFLCLFF